MIIRNTIKSLALVGATAALLPLGGAVAGSNGPGFDNIVVKMGTTGDVRGCPANATCNVLITGEGFLQQEVDLNGTVYVQTVIVDPMSSAATIDTDVGTLAFSDMTFIRMDGSAAGIKGLQRLSEDPDDGSGNLFTGSTELLIGSWASEAGKADINIAQSFRDNSGTGVAIGASGASQTEDDFVNTFAMGVNLAADGSQLGAWMDMQQDVGMSDPTVTVPGNDFQSFVIRQRSGDLLTTTGSLVLQPESTSVGTGGTVSWAAADDMMVAWLGQRVGLGELGVSKFGYQNVKNRKDPLVDDEVYTFSRSLTDIMDPNGPFDWDATFGPAPSL